MNDRLALHGSLRLELRGRDGRIKRVTETANLVTDAGRDAVVERMDSSPTTAAPSHMAVGTGTTEPAPDDATLETETARRALTSSTSSGGVLTMVASWGESGVAEEITEAGILNASSAGLLYSRAVFEAVPKTATDTLTATWTYTLAAE